MRYPALVSILTSTLLALNSPAMSAESTTSISLGADYTSGKYGDTETTESASFPLSLKHETGAWTFRASLPFVMTEGVFARDQGGTTKSGLRNEKGIGDLSLGVSYNLINLPNGTGVDIGAKAKIATADKANTLISSGENDYSGQIDVFRSFTRSSVFATLGYTQKGTPSGVTYTNPLYVTLGASLMAAPGHTLGMAWDFRQKLTSAGDPVSEVSAFYSLKLSPTKKMQLYGIRGLSDASPDFGGGVVLTSIF